jgi:hypothetical protein
LPRCFHEVVSTQGRADRLSSFLKVLTATWKKYVSVKKAPAVARLAEGLLNLLVILGRPGVQKSRTMQRAGGERACWIDGSATAFGLYGQLYQERDRPVVIDDVDGLYTDRAAVRLLKGQRQTVHGQFVHTGSLSLVAS